MQSSEFNKKAEWLEVGEKIKNVFSCGDRETAVATQHKTELELSHCKLIRAAFTVLLACRLAHNLRCSLEDLMQTWGLE